MLLPNNQHLTYCTNIHPGENWTDVFAALKSNLPDIKQRVSPNQSFGIGLRLSDAASRDLAEKQNLSEFSKWLIDNGFYVFTMNGFPFGGFHRQRVKDDVHTPDWTTKERLDYTKRLAFILAELPGDNLERGISTSPVSYKHWHKTQSQMDQALKTAADQMIELVHYLIELKERTGKLIHIDIEPEPDGVIENSEEMIEFYSKWLIPAAKGKFSDEEKTIKEHIQVCYDVCHFAVGYEKPAEVVEKFNKENIRIGKIQISAALKVDLPAVEKREEIRKLLQPFEESTYLHQVVQRNRNGSFTQFSDLPFALEKINDPEAAEWRTHFHVPIFKQSYNTVQSTQADIVEVLKLNQKHKLTNHLEIETYTWEVLPKEERQDLKESIIRELEWVISVTG